MRPDLVDRGLMDPLLVLTHLAAAAGGILIGWSMRDRRRPDLRSDE